VAAIWMIGSLPIPGNVAAGTNAQSFDPVGFGLALTLVASWGWAKWRPHPVLFLVDSFWFLMLAGYLAVDVYNGRNKWWLVLIILNLWLVTTGLKHFRRFRGTKIIRHNLYV
jgi:hypothetical protein